MRIVKQGHKIEYVSPEALKLIELAGRTCYKSEEKITESSAFDFVQMVLKRGHESVIEHSIMTVRFVCDRGVSHELVRHRLAAYSQESTRYCNYSKNKFGSYITVIHPMTILPDTDEWWLWQTAMENAEDSYFKMIRAGVRPEIARGVLPNDLKTEVVMTANFREWRHVFKLRCSSAAHPHIRALMKGLLIEAASAVPVIFEDLHDEFIKEHKHK